MVRSDGTICAGVLIEDFCMGTALAWRWGEPPCPFVVAVSLVFFGCAAKVTSGKCNGRLRVETTGRDEIRRSGE